MAEIVKACDTSAPSRPLVAVKRILPHLCEDEQYTTMFLDESRVLAQLDHPNVIHAFEIGEVEGTPYIALDYVDGHDTRALFQRTRGGDERIPVAVACHVMACVCDGLHHAHERADAAGEPLGLVHRDVSLQNILLSYSGDVKVTDFGIAVSSQNLARTEVGVVKGKFGYMSPEQIKGAPLDRRSDIFGVGICLHELLTGERLFAGDNDYKAIEKVRNVDIDPPSALNRAVPSELERIVMKALAKQPRDRYQTALELREDLLAFMAAAAERCTRDDLGAYLRGVFAEEYASEAGDLSRPADASGRAAARGGTTDVAAVPAVASSPLLDAATGLAAFDHLEPVSSVSFAAFPELDADAEADAAGLPPSPVAHRGRGGTLPPGGLAAAPLAASERRAPSVPPVVPRPDSIPGTLQASELLGDLEAAPARGNGNAVPEPRPLNMDWDEHEPTTISRDLGHAAALAGGFSHDDEVTRIRFDDTVPGLPTSASSGAFPRDVARPSRVSLPPALAHVRTLAPPWAARPWLKPIAVGAAICGLSALLLWWSSERGSGSLRLTTEPHDAIVTVDGQRVAGRSSPYVISDLDSSAEHTIAVEKPGHQGWSTRLRLRPDQVLDLPLVRLEPDAAPAPEVPPAAAAPLVEPARPATLGARHPGAPRAKAPAGALRGEPAKARAPSKQREPRPAEAPAKPPTAAAAKGGMGTLRINTRPWSRVLIDGRLIGNTPQLNIQLPAGNHTLSLVNPEFGINKNLTVKIKAGETITRVLTLQ